MNKVDYIAKYGKGAYAKLLSQSRKWRVEYPESSKEISNKGGKYYERTLKYNRTGLRGERRKIRTIHSHKWLLYKRIIAPNSQIHHQWRPQSAEYDGLALVEADQHMFGFIDVIQVLEGEITLFTEEEIRSA